MQRSYRGQRRRQSRIGILAIFLICALVVGACFVRTRSLQKKNDQLQVSEHTLEQQLSDANRKTVELEELEKYMQTKKYIEDEAKSKLGLVYPDEIVIKPREKE